MMGGVNSHERKQTNQIIHFTLVLFVFLQTQTTGQPVPVCCVSFWDVRT